MNKHILFYYPCASITNAQLPLLKIAALWFDKLVILDPVGASWDTISADHITRDAVRQLRYVIIREVKVPKAGSTDRSRRKVCRRTAALTFEYINRHDVQLTGKGGHQ